MLLAIDFDGVIHDYKNPVEGRRMGPPIDGAKDALKKYMVRGDEVVIFSTWATEKGQKTIREWLHYYHIPFSSVTNIKPNADVYIDDKAIRFINWDEIHKYEQEKGLTN